MRSRAVIAIAVVLALASGLVWQPPAASGQTKQLKIGVIFDQTGPLAGGGSLAGHYGTKYAIDIINERGGVEGYKIVPVYADAQSKVEVAVNEGERLINEQKVDMLMGVFSSAECVPLSAKVEAAKKFWWANVCISSAVFRNKNLQYVFRSHVHSDLYGEASCNMLAEFSKSKLGKEPKDLKVAIIHEDGPYGVGVAASNDSRCRELGLQVVLKEGYAATSADLSALISKLRRSRPDVLLHTGYNPDITLFVRQAKEAGLKVSALIGHGAGYSQFQQLAEKLGGDINFVFNVDSPDITQLDANKLTVPDAKQLIAEMVNRYRADTKLASPSVTASIGFNNAWIFFTDVLPRAIKKYGGVDTEALRKAALETEIPEGGTLQGYGVKFNPPGHVMAGQNARAFPVVTQYVDGQNKIVFPLSMRTADPILPLPASHPLAN